MNKTLMLAAALLALAVPAVAQEPPSPVTASLAETLKDPTTYIPAVSYGISASLDWSSSQALFAKGATEINSGYTASGAAFAAPLSYAAGNHKILVDTVEVLGISAANNVVVHFLSNKIAVAHPEKKGLIKTVSLIERLGFSAALAYGLSAQHLNQWDTNEAFASRKW